MHSSTKLITFILIVPFLFTMCINPKNEDKSQKGDIETKTENTKVKNGIQIIPQIPVSQNSVNTDSVKEGYFTINDIVIQGQKDFSDIDYDNQKVKIYFPLKNANDNAKIYSGVYQNKFVVDIELSKSDTFDASGYIELDIEDFSSMQSVLIRLFSVTQNNTIVINSNEIFIDDSEIEEDEMEGVQIALLRSENSPTNFNNYFINEYAVFINSITKQENNHIIKLLDIDNNFVVDTAYYKKVDDILLIKLVCTEFKNQDNRASEINIYELTIAETAFNNTQKIKVEKSKGDERKRKTIKIDPKKIITE